MFHSHVILLRLSSNKLFRFQNLKSWKVQQPTMKSYLSVGFARRLCELPALTVQYAEKCLISRRVGCNVLFMIIDLRKFEYLVTFNTFSKMDTLLFVYSAL